MSRRALKRLVPPVVIGLVALFFWDSAIVYPLRVFVVFLHEISHGLAAATTGGRIVAIGLTFDEGGVCITDGGSRFLILNAGYLGSLFWGALFLVLSARTRLSREITGFVGVFVLAVTLLYVRSWFGFVYGLVAGAALVAAAVKLPRDIVDDLLQTIGVVSCLYAVWDVGSDVVTRDVPGSDASALGLLTGVPGVLWGLAWIALSLAVVFFALRIVARGGRS
jgi:Peptidase M50B-like